MNAQMLRETGTQHPISTQWELLMNAQQQIVQTNAMSWRIARLRNYFDSGRTRPLAYRQQQLAGLARFLRERETDLQRAVQQDIGKPPFETTLAEVSFVANEVQFARKRLRSWMKPERVSTPIAAQPGRSRIYREPLGVVLIIGAWNYPIQLVLAPLVGAIAAGNCAVIKPSEMSAATSALLAELLPRYLDPESVQVIEGGVPETTALLSERFDHIFYTGNGTVGRIVMEAAAKQLIPVTLELGGKTPCIVDQHTDLRVAARRIVWGRFLNAGQSCVAPDYVLVHRDIEQALLSQLKQTIQEFFGPDPRISRDYGRIVNVRHHRRLMSLISGSGDVFYGGEADEGDRYISPTILHSVSPESPAMRDEIFGPILPVLKVDDINEAIAFVNQRPKPLALYLFTSKGDVRERVIARTSSGAVLVNHTCIHMVVPGLPFGGIGASGMGAYHGRASFETFSHRKAVLSKPTALDLPFLYPPYSEKKKKILKVLV